jgi:hypothetical protein
MKKKQRSTGAARLAYVVGQLARGKAIAKGKTHKEAWQAALGARRRLAVIMAKQAARETSDTMLSPLRNTDRGSAYGSTMVTPDNPERAESTETVRRPPHTKRYVRLGGTVGQSGIVRDPAVSLSYWVRAKFNAPGIAPAKLIDPKTGEVRGYQDPITRRIFPTWPPPQETSPETP